MSAPLPTRIGVVAVGGAVGAALRYTTELVLPDRELPWGTLAANLLGCVLVAAVIVLLEETRRAAEAGMLPADIDIDVDLEVEQQAYNVPALGRLAAPALLGERGMLLRLLLGTGLGGGLTTFSTFAVDIVDLFDEGRPRAAVAYASITITLGIVLVSLTATLTRRAVPRLFPGRQP